MLDHSDKISQNTSDYYFEELMDAVSLFPDVEAIYARYLTVFFRMIAEHTKFTSIQFGGVYARTSHLLREHGATRKFAWQVNDTRVRISKFANMEDKTAMHQVLYDNYLYDFETLCRFAALIYVSSLPKAVIDMLPPPREISMPTQDLPDSDSIRVTVERHDEEYIYGESEHFSQTVKVSFTPKWRDDENLDFSYLKPFLYKGSQINLVRPAIRRDSICAEYIIFEPDYLVGASEVANCFRPHAVTHIQQLLDRLKPEVSTEAILLGNFTGQLLDEEINQNEKESNYQDSVKKFFKAQAFSLATVNIGPDFHNKAKLQKENIKKAFSELPAVVKGYDKAKAVLEPTFLSPMLGIQGRVDLMLLDHSFLVEQKSGNSSYPGPRTPSQHPRPQESHYVQMLLYMMIMRYNYPKLYAENKGISSFLLYSKYPISLCGLSWAPRIEFEAIKIRNLIAVANHLYAKKGVGILDTIFPEKMRMREVNDRLWDNYTSTEIAAILDPIQSSPSVERKYFHRMIRFISLEHLLSKVGCNGTDMRGMASIWLNPLDVKMQAGDIYTSMRLISPAPYHKGSVETVSLAFEQNNDNTMANFRKGDIVILYPYAIGTVPDACRTMILRCAISEIASDRITLHLHAPQGDCRIFTRHKDWLWAIEHDFMESSYGPLYRGIHSLLTTDKSRRDLLMLKRMPEKDISKNLIGKYGVFDDLAVRVKRARDLFLIIGPPGTGKTSFGMLNTLKEELNDNSAHAIVTAYTNRAVDEICGKLTDEGIGFLRLGSKVSAEERYHGYLLEKKVDDCNNLQNLKDAIIQTRVIVGTTAAFCRNISLFKMKRFSLAIIDEASQILEPQILPILTAMHGSRVAVEKFVMIGDHKQLPAVVQQSVEESKVDDPELNNIGLYDCRLSLFERLLRRYGDNPDVTYMLTHQGRMHAEIAAFVNEAFYEGRLDVVPLKHQMAELPNRSNTSTLADVLAARRLAFVAIEDNDTKATISDKVNCAEASIIAEMAVEIFNTNRDKFTSDSTIGIIVPYRNQIVAIRKAIEAYNVPQLANITIDTVERFQGSQRDYIIYGFTIHRRYQLDFLTSTSFEENGMKIDRKLNVAMTRAKEHLILVGNPNLLSYDSTHRRLIKFLKDRDCFFDSTEFRR